MREDRLLKLAGFLDTLPRKKFDFGEVMNNCGTCGCACGWIPTVFPDECKELGIVWDGWTFRRNGTRTSYYRVASLVFEMDEGDALYLFTPGDQSRIGLPNVPENATPKRVAKLIRAYVQKYGEKQ